MKLSTITPILLATSMVFLSACGTRDNDENLLSDDAEQDVSAPNMNDTDTNEPDTDEPSTDTNEPDTDEPGADTNEPDADAPDTNEPDANDPDSNEQNNNPPLSDVQTTISYAYTFTRASDYTSGQIERISITDGNVVDGTYPGAESDHRLASDGYGLYQIGRFNIDNLTKFDPVDTSVVGYQLSVQGDQTNTTNPQSLAFVDDDLAYLTRRNSDSILIVDPTPEEFTSDSLIQGVISLADYNRGSGDELDLPDMTDAVIVGSKLFVLLENLDGFAPVNTGYLAVIDLNNNTEIETDKGEFPLKGIQLQTSNPTSLQYNESTGLLYVAGRGNAFGNPDVTGDPYAGGIESIDPTTYITSLLVDDGDVNNNNGFFSEALVINATLGYVITLDGYNEDFTAINNLRTFNPSTGEVSDPIPSTEGLSLTSLSLAPDNELWVGIQDVAPGFMRIDLNSGEIIGERIITNLIPTNVIFIEANVQ